MWRIIFQNFWFKLVALLMALLLWFHVATDKVYEYTRSFSLEISNIPAHLILAEKIPDQVKVKIRGKGKELLKLLLAERESIKIDVKELKNGETDYVIKPEQIPIPEGSGLQVTDILSPPSLKIKLDHLLEKKVKVQPHIGVLPADGFVQVGELHYGPKEVMISGPKIEVTQIEVIHTKEKVIQNAEKSVSEQLDLVMPPGYNLKVSLPVINFSVEIQKAVEKEFSHLPVKLINIPRRREILLQPDSISLTIFGPESLVTHMLPDKIKAVIDCAKTENKDKLKLPVIVELPSEVKLKRVEPESLEVLVK
jgi:YbbR domain-containing protein